MPQDGNNPRRRSRRATGERQSPSAPDALTSSAHQLRRQDLHGIRRFLILTVSRDLRQKLQHSAVVEFDCHPEQVLFAQRRACPERSRGNLGDPRDASRALRRDNARLDRFLIQLHHYPAISIRPLAPWRLANTVGLGRRVGVRYLQKRKIRLLALRGPGGSGCG
jgi:hypothetical protein